MFWAGGDLSPGMTRKESVPLPVDQTGGGTFPEIKERQKMKKISMVTS